MYGNDVMSDTGVRKCYIMFKNGHANVHKEVKRFSKITASQVWQVFSNFTNFFVWYCNTKSMLLQVLCEMGIESLVKRPQKTALVWSLSDFCLYNINNKVPFQLYYYISPTGGLPLSYFLNQFLEL